MDFKPVFQNLLEIFPEVDMRILKAVAIEHSDDGDAAVESVLYEILPSLGGRSKAAHTGQDTHDISSEVQTRDQVLKLGVKVSGAVQPETRGYQTGLCSNSSSLTECCSERSEGYIVNGETDSQCSSLLEHQYLIGGDQLANGINGSVSECEQQLSTSAEADFKLCHDTLSSISKIMESGDCRTEAQNELDDALAENEQCHSVRLPDISELLSFSVEMIPLGEKNLSRISSTQFVYVDPPEGCVTDAHHMSSVSENIIDLENPGGVLKDTPSASGEDEEHHCRSVANNCSDMYPSSSEMLPLKENDLTIVASRSGYTVNADALDDYVTDAKNNKKNLASAVESVIIMMKEADGLEDMAKQAKEEASSAGEDTFMKVVELKQMLEHAKQANDMHAGEVYGEKSILSTEARELQSRLLSLSDERNKSFSIIEEVQRTLEARIIAAESEIVAAEQEKFLKEESAQKALKEQEAIMDSVVQESRRLQEEAEENAKLRDFLMDRGSVVDALQGEMAVILEDIMLLKERVDGRLPLGRSLMTTYSSASLSASSFSQKTTSSASSDLQIVESRKTISSDEPSKKQEEEDHMANGGKKPASSEEQKRNSDDEWEIYDREAYPF